MRDIRSQLAATGPGVTRASGDFDCISLPPPEADVLRDVLIREQPGTVVEIGLSYASSALAIAEALLLAGKANPRHLIIDPYQTSAFHRAGWQQIEAAGVAGMCELMEERSQYALPRLAAVGLAADAAFVDGSHIFHNVFVDLYFLNQVVRAGGLVILDDCTWPSVATAVGYYERHLAWKPEPIPTTTRLRAYRLPGSQPAVDFTAFTPPGPDGW